MIAMTSPPPTRRPGRPRREEVGDIEQRLMDAAVMMLMQHGSAVTMNALITASGLSRKTVYARYPNMSALLLSVLRKVLDFEMTPLMVPDGPDWRIALRDFIGSLQEEVTEPRAQALRRILLMDSTLLEEVKPQIEQLVVRRYIDPISGFFARLIERGDIPPQDTVFAAEALMRVILMEAHQRFLEGEGGRDAEAFTSNLARLFCGGLLAEPDVLRR